MDALDVIEFLLRGLFAMLMFSGLLWVTGYQITKKLNYNFQCTICDFKASASNLEILTIIKQTHRHNILEVIDKEK